MQPADPALVIRTALNAHSLCAAPPPSAAPPLQIGISPTIPLTADQLADIPLQADSFCRFAQTDAAPALF